MKLRKSTALLAFVLACSISAIATFGFIFEQGSRIPSIRRTVGYDLTYIGEPGFVVGAILTGGQQTSLASTVIAGTVFNVVLNLVWNS
jgi:hypothetical protein